VIKKIIGFLDQNTYIVSQKKEAVVIDVGASAEQIVTTLQENGLKLVGILLTHGHFDHTCSLPDLLEVFSCPVYIHESEQKLLLKPSFHLGGLFGRSLKQFDLATLTPVSDCSEIEFESLKFSVIHTPGHTLGSVCFLHKNHLFTGDTLFTGGVGRTDLPTGNKVKLQSSIKHLCQSLSNKIIIHPGHGVDSTLSNECKYNPYLSK
jgi:glyoxylase-like metal-dependent hydrolase (beta-lactamase superfamily II)